MNTVKNRYFLKPEEVAEYLGLGRTKVYELIRAGKLKSVLVAGRSRRVSREALNQFVQSVDGQESIEQE